MPIHSIGFSKVTIKGAISVDPANSKLVHVETPHALIQAAGYIKHNVAKKGIYGVYFRGQQHLYEKLTPSLYRGLHTIGAASARHGALKKLLERIESEKQVLRDLPEYTIEPLLQHYGFRTRWLDIVDNIWIALWFACFRARTWGPYDEFLHFERRQPEKEEENDRYAYVLLLSGSHNKSRKYQPGLTGNNHSEVLDLRYAIPSYFVRPHSQHGLLIRQKDKQNGTALDFSNLIEGVIRINISDGLEWLGSGRTFDVHSLFPPPSYDSGYQQLLQLRDYGNKTIGAVHHIGA
jgi:FRG domain